MIEFDVDMGYLLDEGGNPRTVVLNDENGDYGPMRFVRERTCEMENDGELPARKLPVWFCSECGSPTYNDMMPFYCQYCGAKVVDA